MSYGSSKAHQAHDWSAGLACTPGVFKCPLISTDRLSPHAVEASWHLKIPLPESGTALVSECTQSALKSAADARPHLVSKACADTKSLALTRSGWLSTDMTLIASCKLVVTAQWVWASAASIFISPQISFVPTGNRWAVNFPSVTEPQGVSAPGVFNVSRTWKL